MTDSGNDNKRKRHKNIPFFIPHSGCGHSCVFCNQVKITGFELCAEEIENEVLRLKLLVEESLTTIGEAEAEIAFFGGSFTGIEPKRRRALLEEAYRYIKSGEVGGIRLSTRPDYINGDILDELEAFGVKAIELGMQSTDDEVLSASERGHLASDCFEAAELILDRGFELTGQMMIGLPKSTFEKELRTAEDIVGMGAKSARIYPTVVFADTKLYNMVLEGKYSPLSNEEAIERSAGCLEVFDRHEVKLLRIGLHASENLRKAPCGANHPAMGEAVYSRVVLRNIEEAIKKAVAADVASRIKEKARIDFKGSVLKIYASPASRSAAAGYGGENKSYLKEKYGFGQIKVYADESLAGRKVRIEVEG